MRTKTRRYTDTWKMYESIQSHEKDGWAVRQILIREHPRSKTSKAFECLAFVVYEQASTPAIPGA